MKTTQAMFRAALKIPSLVVLALMAGMPSIAVANDSIAELGTGGIMLSFSDSIFMEQEDLFISPERVTVEYVFRNGSDQDIERIVAFPMPEIESDPFEMLALPDDSHDNFLDFEVSVDGKPVEPNLEHRAFAVGIEVTDDLRTRGVPLFPFGDAAFDALAALPDNVADDWIARGIISMDGYDQNQRWPYWQLRSTYWWRMTFPAGKTVRVAHRYKPSVGGTSGLNFFYDGKFQGEAYEEYKQKYCIDHAFERAVLKAYKGNPDGDPRLTENRISYILTTGGNWALGTIGKFRLTVDKGKPENIVSFCGTGVRKTGTTTFEMTAEDYNPDRNLDILILESFTVGDSDPAAPATANDGN